jgi:hypothetical protein
MATIITPSLLRLELAESFTIARITVGLQADSKVAVAALLNRLKEGGKPDRQPDAETLRKIKQRKPPAISYDDGKWVDPRRAANYLETNCRSETAFSCSTAVTR